MEGHSIYTLTFAFSNGGAPTTSAHELILHNALAK